MLSDNLHHHFLSCPSYSYLGPWPLNRQRIIQSILYTVILALEGSFTFTPHILHYVYSLIKCLNPLPWLHQAISIPDKVLLIPTCANSHLKPTSAHYINYRCHLC